MFHLKLVTPTKTLVNGQEVEDVIVPAFRGELNILPGHAPLVTTLTTGRLQYRLQGETQYKVAAISWGYCEVHPNGVTILAETAEEPGDVDVARAKSTLQAAQQRLASADIDPEDIEKYQRKVQRAEVRLSVAEDNRP